MKTDNIARLRAEIDAADAIIVGGASGMSAASGFQFYYKNDEVYKLIAGGLADKYKVDGFFPLFYHPQIEKEELWAALIREYKYLYECHTGESYTELAELLKGKQYYIVTTNQDGQFYRTFPAGRISRLQGDFRYWQCARQCHDEIYDNHDRVMELAEKIEGDRLPTELIPRCPHCGAELVPWWRSREFLEGEFYQAEVKRYYDFIRQHQHERLLFLELGVGMMTPMFIKEPFMNMVYQLPKATYVTVNPQHAIVPKEIADKSIAVEDDILLTLKKLNGKSVDGMEFDRSNVFDPGRVY